MAIGSTGWETMLEGLLATGFQISGTWPMRTEMVTVNSQRHQCPSLLYRSGVPTAPLDTPARHTPGIRAGIETGAAGYPLGDDGREYCAGGPGAGYHRTGDGDLLPLLEGGRGRRFADARAHGAPDHQSSLDEQLSEAEGDVDSHTRFAITWFEQRGMESGPYGEAESIATARNVSVRGVVETGILEARAGKVHLLPREKLLEDGTRVDGRITDWEIVQYLIRALETEGEQGAAMLLQGSGSEARRRGTSPTASTASASGRSGRRRHSPTTPLSSPGPR